MTDTLHRARDGRTYVVERVAPPRAPVRMHQRDGLTGSERLGVALLCVVLLTLFLVTICLAGGRTQPSDMPTALHN